MTTILANKFSVETYLALDDASERKHEYANGDVLFMDGETLEHNAIVSNLICQVGSFLKYSEAFVYPSAFRTGVPNGRGYFYPDVSVVLGKTELQPRVFDTLMNPVIIFEVISESTENIDRGYKFFHYQQIPSLQEYVLVDSREYALDVIRRQAHGAWKFEKYFRADKQVRLHSIDCTLSFDDVYFEVRLPRSK